MGPSRPSSTTPLLDGVPFVAHGSNGHFDINAGKYSRILLNQFSHVFAILGSHINGSSFDEGPALAFTTRIRIASTVQWGAGAAVR
jgi:hypothetical protein